MEDFLLRLATKDSVVYLYADRGILVKRADVPKGFMYREYVIYNVLMRYVARCRIDTGMLRPVEAAVGVLRCLGLA